MDALANNDPIDGAATNTLPTSRQANAPGISFILPAFNEQETIEQAICEADDALAALTADYEILVVDDGSSDETAAIAGRLASQRRAVRVLRQPRNLGYGAALSRGFQTARKQLVAFTDADCQFDVRELDRLVMLARDYQIVCGYRIDRQDPWHRKLYSAAYNSLVRLLLGTGVRDCDCALKVFRREVVQSIDIETDGFFVNAEVLTKARLQDMSIVEVGVTHRPRTRGRSTVSAFHAFPVVATLLRFWWNAVLFPQRSRHTHERGDRWSAPFQFGATMLLLLASLLLLVSNLSYPLIEPDETRYGQIALEMFESADWITPTLDGKPYLDKPPLIYWLTAASYQAFGENEAAARLPCALSAVLTVLLTFCLGQRLVGTRGAWCGAAALLLCGGFVLSGRFLIMDGLLTLFTTAALLAAYIATNGNRLRLGWWIAAGAACGLGVLTKGPIALVLCVPPLLAERWLTGGTYRLRLRDWMVFAAPVLLLTVPWFAAIAQLHPEFPSYFMGKHHFQRFFSAFNHIEPWWYYLPALVVGMFPASLLLPGLAAFLFSRKAEREARSRELGFLLLAAVWTIGFFSMSSCKLPTYILPALPPMCLLLGSVLERYLLRLELSRRVTALMNVIPQRTALTMLAAAVAVAIVDWVAIRDVGDGVMLNGAVVLAAGIMLFTVWRRRLTHAPMDWTYAVVIALAVTVFAFESFIPSFSHHRSIHAAAVELHSHHSGVPVVYFGQSSHSACLHLQPNEIVRFQVDELAQCQAFIESRPQTVVVATRDGAVELQRTLNSSIGFSPQGGRGRVYLTSRRNESALRLGERYQSSVKR